MKTRLCAALLSVLLLFSLASATVAAREPVVAPSGLYATEDGGYVITDLYHHAVWQRSPTGKLTRLAGREGTPDARGLPTGGYLDAAAADAAFATPWAIAPYRGGWAVTDADNHAVRYLADGKVSTLAGGNGEGRADGEGAKASFSLPTGLAAGEDGCLYVSDTGNSLIRRIDKDGKVTTWAGNGEGRTDGALSSVQFLEPTGLCWAEGVLYVADSGNNRVCKIETGVVTTLAGGLTGEDGFANGPAGDARLSYPQGVAVHGDSVYVADTGNGAVRLIQDGSVTTLVKSGGLGGGLWPVSPRGLAFSSNALVVGDTFARTVFTLPLVADGYADVPADAWFAPAVARVSAARLMVGTGPNTFSPQSTMTRAMAITVLSRLAGATLPAVDAAPFPDVAVDAWYAPAVAWSVGEGLAQGGEDGRFSPHRSVTRAELAALLYRYSTSSGLKTATGDLSIYSDGDAVPAWAKEALTWAAGGGLFTPVGALDPSSPATRAETASILVRFLTYNNM